MVEVLEYAYLAIAYVMIIITLYRKPVINATLQLTAVGCDVLLACGALPMLSFAIATAKSAPALFVDACWTSVVLLPTCTAAIGIMVVGFLALKTAVMRAPYAEIETSFTLFTFGVMCSGGPQSAEQLFIVLVCCIGLVCATSVAIFAAEGIAQASYLDVCKNLLEFEDAFNAGCHRRDVERQRRIRENLYCVRKWAEVRSRRRPKRGLVIDASQQHKHRFRTKIRGSVTLWNRLAHSIAGASLRCAELRHAFKTSKELTSEFLSLVLLVVASIKAKASQFRLSKTVETSPTVDREDGEVTETHSSAKTVVFTILHMLALCVCASVFVGLSTLLSTRESKERRVLKFASDCGNCVESHADNDGLCSCERHAALDVVLAAKIASILEPVEVEALLLMSLKYFPAELKPARAVVTEEAIAIADETTIRAIQREQDTLEQERREEQRCKAAAHTALKEFMEKYQKIMMPAEDCAPIRREDVLKRVVEAVEAVETMAAATSAARAIQELKLAAALVTKEEKRIDVTTSAEPEAGGVRCVSRSTSLHDDGDTASTCSSNSHDSEFVSISCPSLHLQLHTHNSRPCDKETYHSLALIFVCIIECLCLRRGRAS